MTSSSTREGSSGPGQVSSDWSVSIILSSDWSDMFSLGQPDPVSVTYHKEVQIIFSMKEITKLNTEVED